MAANIFGQGRRRLTLFYSLIMCVFLIALIFIAHKTLEWSIFSEQARELLDTAGNVAEAQAYFNQHPGLTLEDAGYKSTNDRLFFYVFNQDGRLSNFARASFHIEPFILDVVSNWQAQEGEVSVFGRKNERDQMTRIMMTAKTIVNDDGSVQTVYVGKDVTAMYNGLQKSTYAMVVLGIVALLLATVLGHILSGRAMVPLREAYEKQRQFAADASHELRTPLAVVMASADLLENDPSITSPFLKQVIADVRDEVKKMTRLVSDLLLVARSDNKALKLKLQKFDAAELLSQTARLMQPLADKKHIALDIRNRDAHVIQADEQKIKQLMLILVDNAVKYTPDGGEVHVGFEKAPQGRVRFFVQDTGIGIAKEDQRRIFDRFYRVDKARSREMGGNGLGLSIAQEIVNLHQGSIEVTSTLGKGTRFTVELRTKARAKTA
ncbi:ATP-binding protein [uncultured Selenomonas sp.]|uniref:sensor histidine kinase n=1 Tax=uncultured Selenomonas sp. TaxID=159275 RepID=UPI0028045830|nr:ATP-binding protein [uncultured Selenomonas sp.]